MHPVFASAVQLRLLISFTYFEFKIKAQHKMSTKILSCFLVIRLLVGLIHIGIHGV